MGLGVWISDELPAIWLNVLKLGVRALEPGEQSHPANVTSLITMKGPHCQPHLGFHSCFYLGHLCFTPRPPAHAWKVGWSASSLTTLEGLSFSLPFFLIMDASIWPQENHLHSFIHPSFNMNGSKCKGYLFKTIRHETQSSEEHTPEDKWRNCQP